MRTKLQSLGFELTVQMFDLRFQRRATDGQPQVAEPQIQQFVVRQFSQFRIPEGFRAKGCGVGGIEKYSRFTFLLDCGMKSSPQGTQFRPPLHTSGQSSYRL
ncbi:MAG: hypothetical protein R3C49_26080 [Planctomycetaceae bacterium]